MPVIIRNLQMNTEHASNPAVWASRLASFSSLFAVTVGVIVLTGWSFDIAVLKSILPGWFPMKANAALCFILTGGALFLTARPPATLNPRLSIFLSCVARLCELLVGLIGVLTLSEYTFGWNLSIDQWLFREPVGAVGTSHPGRMAQEAALSFVLLSVALRLTGAARKTRVTVLASITLGILVATLALSAMLSYLTPSLGAYGWFGLSIMALHAAITLAILGVAVIAISWQPNVMPWSLGRTVTQAFVCGMVVLVFIGFTSSRAQFQLKETERHISHSEQVMAGTHDLMFEVFNAQTAARGYVITGDDRFRVNYLAVKAKSAANLESLRNRVADHPHQQSVLAEIEVPVKTLIQWFQQVIDARQSGMGADKLNTMLVHGEDLLKNLTDTADQIEVSHLQHIEQLQMTADNVSNTSYRILFIGTLTSLLIFLTTIFKLNIVENERVKLAVTLSDNASKLRLLSQHVLEAQETERRRLAIELHDELGQALAAIKINLQGHERFQRQSPAEFIAENIGIVEDALKQVRRLALALRPPMLDDLGLVPALRWISEQTEERGDLVVQFDASMIQSRLAPEIETACFRIVQESINNIVRHAQARFVKIDLHQDADILVLSVQDDGCGFDPAAMRDRALAGASMGILGMQERAALIGGQLDVQSTAGQGSRVCLRCPLHPHSEAI